MISLWKEKNYISNIKFIIDRPIVEYDISKANISVLRDAGAISEDQYAYLYNCPKDERSIIVGKMQRDDRNVTNILNDGIANARRVFMENNGIQDSEVLAIRNDSITVLSDRCMNTNITDRVQFRIAGSYRSYYKLIRNIELFYDYDLVSNKEVLDAKGLGDAHILHRNFMLEFLSEIFYQAQLDNVETALSTISNFYNQYIHRELDIGYYRELNSQSCYRLNSEFTMLGYIMANNLSNEEKQYLDIGFNAQILCTLVSYLSSIYFNKR